MPLLPVRVLRNHLIPKLFHLLLMVDCFLPFVLQIVLRLVLHHVLRVQTFLLRDVDPGRQLLQLKER